eukprot:TRINITY_DN3776_c0_g1_i1.p1 TRINITY_DN3776_c0_g1~~TRINITY_DN3776_c0_g1_i1.p1  ORF type:complete len:238 (+),score=35.57 TRINITY_DN3776_c0_g1_i1:72-785(+)
MNKRFSGRNKYYLRIGRNTVIPVILYLNDPASFNDVLFQDLLGELKDKLPQHLIVNPRTGLLSTTETKFSSENPYVYRGNGLTFKYYFAKPETSYCVLAPTGIPQNHQTKPKPKESTPVPVEISDDENEEKKSEKKTFVSEVIGSSTNKKGPKIEQNIGPTTKTLQVSYNGGSFLSNRITEHTLVIESFNTNELQASLNESASQAIISHYFEAEPNKVKKRKKPVVKSNSNKKTKKK